MQFCSETREYMCLVGTCEKWWKRLSLFLPLRKRASLSVEVFKCLNWEAWKGPSSANFEVLHLSLGCFGVGQSFDPRLALFFMWHTSTEEQQRRCVRLATADACVAFPVLLTDVEGANVSLLDSHSSDGTTNTFENHSYGWRSFLWEPEFPYLLFSHLYGCGVTRQCHHQYDFCRWRCPKVPPLR